MLPRAESYRGFLITWLINAGQYMSLIQPEGAEYVWPEITSPLSEGMPHHQERTRAAIDAALHARMRIAELASRRGVGASGLPTIGVSLQDGTPHIEVTDAYHLVVCERGIERRRQSTAHLDELLGWIFPSREHEITTA